jgi:hypothetical protein
VPADAKFQAAAAGFIPVRAYYDGLKGNIIKWSFENGNENHDPSVLAWLIDPNGEVIAKSPKGVAYNASGFAKWLTENAGSSFPLVDIAAFPKCKKEAKAIAGRKKLGTTLAALRDYAADGADGVDAEKQAQAKTLMAKLTGYAEWKLEQAAKKRSSNPVAALAIYKELAGKFKGDTIGDKAKSTYDTLKQDKAFKASVTAHQMLAQVRALVASNTKNNKPLPPAVRHQVAGLLAKLTKKYPDTPAGAQARALLDELTK